MAIRQARAASAPPPPPPTAPSAPPRLASGAVKSLTVDELLVERATAAEIVATAPRNSQAYKNANANLNLVNQEIGRDLGIKGNPGTIDDDDLRVFAQIAGTSKSVKPLALDTLTANRATAQSILADAPVGSALYNSARALETLYNKEIGADLKLKPAVVSTLSGQDLSAILDARSDFSATANISSTLDTKTTAAIDAMLGKNIASEEKRVFTQLGKIHQDEIWAIQDFGRKAGLSPEQINALTRAENAANRIESNELRTSQQAPGLQRPEFARRPATEVEERTYIASLAGTPDMVQFANTFRIPPEQIETFTKNLYNNGLYAALTQAYNVPPENVQQFVQELNALNVPDSRIDRLTIPTDIPVSARGFAEQLPDAANVLDTGIALLDRVNAPSRFQVGKTGVGFSTYKAGVADLNRDADGNIQLLPEFRVGTSARGANFFVRQLNAIEDVSQNPQLTDQARLQAVLPDGTQIFTDTLHKWKKGGASASFAVLPDGTVTYLGAQSQMTPTGGGGFKKILAKALPFINLALTFIGLPNPASLLGKEVVKQIGVNIANQTIKAAVERAIGTALINVAVNGGDLGQAFKAGFSAAVVPIIGEEVAKFVNAGLLAQGGELARLAPDISRAAGNAAANGFATAVAGGDIDQILTAAGAAGFGSAVSSSLENILSTTGLSPDTIVQISRGVGNISGNLVNQLANDIDPTMGLVSGAAELVAGLGASGTPAPIEDRSRPGQGATSLGAMMTQVRGDITPQQAAEDLRRAGVDTTGMDDDTVVVTAKVLGLAPEDLIDIRPAGLYTNADPRRVASSDAITQIFKDFSLRRLLGLDSPFTTVAVDQRTFNELNAIARAVEQTDLPVRVVVGPNNEIRYEVAVPQQSVPKVQQLQADIAQTPPPVVAQPQPVTPPVVEPTPIPVPAPVPAPEPAPIVAPVGGGGGGGGGAPSEAGAAAQAGGGQVGAPTATGAQVAQPGGPSVNLIALPTGQLPTGTANVAIGAIGGVPGAGAGNLTADIMDLVRGNVAIQTGFGNVSTAGTGNVSANVSTGGFGNVALGTADTGLGNAAITTVGEGPGVGGGRGEGGGVGIGTGAGLGTGTGEGAGLGGGRGGGTGPGEGQGMGGISLTPTPAPSPAGTPFDLNILDVIRQQALQQEGGGTPQVRTGGGGLITSEEADLSALFGGKPEELQDVWNQASLRLRNALGI